MIFHLNFWKIYFIIFAKKMVESFFFFINRTERHHHKVQYQNPPTYFGYLKSCQEGSFFFAKIIMIVPDYMIVDCNGFWRLFFDIIEVFLFRQFR